MGRIPERFRESARKALPILAVILFLWFALAAIGYSVALKRFAKDAQRVSADRQQQAQAAVETRTGRISWVEASKSRGARFKLDGSDEILFVPVELVGGDAYWAQAEPYFKAGVRVRVRLGVQDRIVREMWGNPDSPFQKPVVTPAQAEAGIAEMPKNAAKRSETYGGLALAAAVVAWGLAWHRKRKNRQSPPGPGLTDATLWVVLSLGAMASTPARAADDTPSFKVKEMTVPGATAAKADLSLDLNQAKVEPYFKDFQTDALTTVPGKMTGQRATLLFSGREVAVAPDGTFKVSFRLTSPRTQFSLTAVDVRGEVRERQYVLDFPGLNTWLAKQQNPYRKRFSFGAGAGFTYLHYDETLSATFTQIGVTIKGLALYIWKARQWDLGASAYFTLVPLTTNQSGSTARFLGLNGRIGYVLPWFDEPWRISVMTGIYYTSMFTTDSAFGFHDLMGPQLYPVVRYVRKNGDVISGYFKFSPVGGGFAIERLANREIAMGASWTSQGLAKGGLTFSIDLADLSLLIDGISISSRSITLSVGRSW